MNHNLMSSHIKLISSAFFILLYIINLSACGDHLKFRSLSEAHQTTTQPSIKIPKEQHGLNHIKLNIYLDLATRQALVQERWNRPIVGPLIPQAQKLQTTDLSRPLLSSALIENSFLVQLEHKLNKNLSDLEIRISVNSVQAWESSLDGKALSLDHLAHTLRSRLTNTSINNQSNALSNQLMNIGLISSPLPSFAQLSDLVWARGGVPVVIVNRPLFYYQNDQTAAHTATTRLLIRGIAESLRIAPVCDGGWGGVKRDKLLGLKPVPLAMTNQQTLPNNLSRDPYLRGAPPQKNNASDFQEDSSPKPWSFKALKWSSSSKTLMKQYSAHTKEKTRSDLNCERFELLQSTCLKSKHQRNSPHQHTLSPSLNSLLRAAGDMCMNDKSSLIVQYQKGYLKHPQWNDYELSAKGLLSLENGQARQALNYCQAVANHQPQILASKCAGLAALELKEYSIASLYLRAYLSSHPNEIESLSLLAKSLGYEGKDEEALALLKRLSFRPKSELQDKRNQILFNLGIAEARLGNLKRAKKAWSQLDPNSGEAKEATKLIKNLELNAR